MIKLAESGRWLGGNTPYGFNIKRQSYITSDFKEKTLSILTPNDSELKVVKLIYSYYIKKRSIRAVEKYLNSNSIIGKKGLVIKDATPDKFYKYFDLKIKQVKKSYSTDMIFIFAWNEWAEGNYMEPDLKFGHGYLDALRDEIVE